MGLKLNRRTNLVKGNPNFKHFDLRCINQRERERELKNPR